MAGFTFNKNVTFVKSYKRAESTGLRGDNEHISAPTATDKYENYADWLSLKHNKIETIMKHSQGTFAT